MITAWLILTIWGLHDSIDNNTIYSIHIHLLPCTVLRDIHVNNSCKYMPG